MVVGREDASNSVRLRLSKQSSKGLNFGLDLNVGVQGADPQLPTNFNDFIEATFGVHGLQVLNDLQQWTDPSVDLGQKIAGLADQTALDLLKSTTGIDPVAEFDKAKAIVANALNQWTALPDKLSVDVVDVPRAAGGREHGDGLQDVPHRFGESDDGCEYAGGGASEGNVWGYAGGAVPRVHRGPGIACAGE